jgi:hypothetical protein
MWKDDHLVVRDLCVLNIDPVAKRSLGASFKPMPSPNIGMFEEHTAPAPATEIINPVRHGVCNDLGFQGSPLFGPDGIGAMQPEVALGLG